MWEPRPGRVALSLGGGVAYMSRIFANENLAFGLVGINACGAQCTVAHGLATVLGWATARYYCLKRNSDITDRLLMLGPGFTFAFLRK
jgi:hypothetical protein